MRFDFMRGLLCANPCRLGVCASFVCWLVPAGLLYYGFYVVCLLYSCGRYSLRPLVLGVVRAFYVLCCVYLFVFVFFFAGGASH